MGIKRIDAPNDNYTGFGGGVQNTAPGLAYVNGSAYLDPEEPGAARQLAYARRKGFEVTDVDTVPADYAARVEAMRGERVQRTGPLRDAFGTETVEPSSPFSQNH